jgi:hypothetical protein
MATYQLPPSDEILTRIRLCRAEQAQLKKLLRAVLAIERADAARTQRQQTKSPVREEARHDG